MTVSTEDYAFLADKSYDAQAIGNRIVDPTSLHQFVV